MNRDKIKKEIGKRLKHFRESSGQNVKGFSERIGISGQTLKKIEAGESIISIPCLWFLAQLGISLNWLIAGNGTEKPVRLAANKRTVSNDNTRHESDGV